MTAAVNLANIATGPAFSAYQSSAQSISASTYTKIVFDTEEFDTASCFNNTGSTVNGIPSYSFLPNVAGYYQFNATADYANATTIVSAFYKNNSNFKASNLVVTNGRSLELSSLIYLNGSTDYVDFRGYTSAAQNTNPGQTTVWFQAFLARAA